MGAVTTPQKKNRYNGTQRLKIRGMKIKQIEKFGKNMLRIQKTKNERSFRKTF